MGDRSRVLVEAVSVPSSARDRAAVGARGFFFFFLHRFPLVSSGRAAPAWRSSAPFLSLAPRPAPLAAPASPSPLSGALGCLLQAEAGWDRTLASEVPQPLRT